MLLFKPLLKPLFKAWSPERCGFVAVLMLLCLCARPLRSLAALSLGQRKSWAQHSRATQQGNMRARACVLMADMRSHTDTHTLWGHGE